MIVKDLGIATAYGYAKSKGYTGTEEEFAILMASYATVAEDAAQSATTAGNAATSASNSAQTATTKASEASTSASNAATSASSAATSASSAATSASNAASSASSANTSAQTATTKAGEASASATRAEEAADSINEPDTTLSIAGRAADAAKTGEEIADVKSALSETTRNLFDTNKLTATGITVNKNDASGTAGAFYVAFDSGIANIGITFEASTQYTASITGTNTGSTTSGNGLQFKFIYTDNTSSVFNFSNSDDKKRRVFTSTEGKTVQNVGFSYSSGSTNTWVIEDIQIEKGSSASLFVPHITATDCIARENCDSNSDRLVKVERSQNAIANNAGFGLALDDYLWIEKAYIDSNLGIVASNAINLYRFPVEANGFVLISWSDSTNPTDGITASYVFTYQHYDGSLSRSEVTSGTCSNSSGAKTICALGTETAQYVIIPLIRSERTDVNVFVNSLYGEFESEYKKPNCVTPLNKNTTPGVALFMSDGGSFSSISGYITLWARLHKGDTVDVKSISGLSYYGVFSGVSGTRQKITTNTLTTSEDGILCLFDTDTPLGHLLIPNTRKKLKAEDIIDLSSHILINPYDGLSGVAFGTSLTYRAETTGGFLQYLPVMSGIEFDNQGIGSATILQASGLPQMMPRITGYTEYASKRICLLEGFVNDWYHNPGKLGTWKDTEQTTVCGCIRYAINHIWSQNANITIFLILDHYGSGINAPDAVNSSGETQYEWWSEIEKVALSMGVRVIREYEIAEISNKTSQYLLDNIHLNALGAEQSAKAIWAGMKATYPNITSNS